MSLRLTWVGLCPVIVSFPDHTLSVCLLLLFFCCCFTLPFSAVKSIASKLDLDAMRWLGEHLFIVFGTDQNSGKVHL